MKKKRITENGRPELTAVDESWPHAETRRDATEHFTRCHMRPLSAQCTIESFGFDRVLSSEYSILQLMYAYNRINEVIGFCAEGGVFSD